MRSTGEEEGGVSGFPAISIVHTNGVLTRQSTPRVSSSARSKSWRFRAQLW